ncbi:MAG: ABC transporter permease [Pirellulaceae bacterium]|nr:ABC transporter permease [Pirellulaceae bacterium]
MTEPSPENRSFGEQPNWTTTKIAFSILRSLAPLLALLIVVLAFAIADQQWGHGRFVEMRNFRVILVMTAPVAIAALGMTLLIISGGIDLSAGTAAMLCTTVLACSLKEGLPVAITIALTLSTGVICGLINGLLIGLLRIPPFIVTLGTMTIFLGIAKRLAQGSTVFVDRERIPNWLLDLSATMPPDWRGWSPNIALGVWIALLVAILVSILLNYTVIGRHIFALGSNEATARLCGINILRTKVIVYGLAGLLIGIAGIYTFSLVKIANPVEGIGRELKFIAAAVIGGGSLSGGRGSVLGTLAGAAIMGVIASGCDQLEIKNSTQDIMIGLIIIAAVTLDQLRRRMGKNPSEA